MKPSNVLDHEDTYEREKQEDCERFERYLLTCEAVPQEKVLVWLEFLAQGKAAQRPR